jgi:SAM-dependent methyltransferase
MTIDNQYQTGEYWDKNPTFHEEDADFKVANAIAMLERNGISPDDILDVGTGSGKHAYLLSERYEVPTVGLDMSARAIDHARQRYSRPDLDFHVADIKQYSSVAHVGFMFDVFEHIEDYMGFLRSASPNSEYWVFNIPIDMNALSIVRGRYLDDRARVGHLHYFSKASALATLEDCGYEIIEWEFANVVKHQLKNQFSMKGLLAAFPRLALYKLSQSFAVNLLGGASLSVLCKSRPNLSKKATQQN